MTVNSQVTNVELDDVFCVKLMFGIRALGIMWRPPCRGMNMHTFDVLDHVLTGPEVSMWFFAVLRSNDLAVLTLNAQLERWDRSPLPVDGWAILWHLPHVLAPLHQ